MTGEGRPGIPFVIAAPSGTGKTSVCKQIVARRDDVQFSVSHTTREPRAGERDGVDYYFVGPEEFESLIRDDAFLESAEYNGNHYGTSRRALDGPLAAGQNVLLEIEIQGARQVRRCRPAARQIFLLPPSMKELKRRLRDRGTDDDEQIDRRLESARGEVAAAGEFDYAVVNDDFDQCIASVLEILDAEGRGETDAVRKRFAPAAALERFRQSGD